MNADAANLGSGHFIAQSDVVGKTLLVILIVMSVAFKLNVNNVTNKLYADSLYTGHYIQGMG